MKRTFIIGIRCSMLKDYNHLYWFYYVGHKQYNFWVESILRCLGNSSWAAYAKERGTFKALQVIKTIIFRTFVRQTNK